MPLPQDWASVDWQQTVIILPTVTEGIHTEVLNSMKFPQYGRAYFMMAHTDSNGRIVYYNAAEVGKAGALASQFVFWHELGHYYLGHTGETPSNPPGVTSPLLPASYGNNEVDADSFALAWWLRQGTRHGLEVVYGILDYFQKLGNDPGDAQHPSAADRRKHLVALLDQRPFKIVVYDDPTTPGDFVLNAFTQVLGMDESHARGFGASIEQHGQGSYGPMKLADAEQKVATILSEARRQSFPLRMEVVPA